MVHLWCHEHNWVRKLFSISAFVVLFAAVLLVAGDLLRSFVLAVMVSAAIAGASSVKYHHSGLKLTVADLALLFSGSVPFMLRQYRQTALIFLGAVFLLMGSAIASVVLLSSGPVSLELRVLCFAIALALFLALFKMAGGATSFRSGLTVRRDFFSSFMASLVDVQGWWWRSGLRISDIDSQSTRLDDRQPALKNDRPDIIIIQHESVFDPRYYGVPIERDIERFFSPANSLSGQLNVEIFGGGSWQSEFSMLTGLSSRSFGPDSYHLYKKGAGRFQHSLPSALQRLGYRTNLIAACRRNFMHYDSFYAGLGVEDRLFNEDLKSPFDMKMFEQTSSDEMFLGAAELEIAERLTQHSAPYCAIVLTNFNHGPHDRRQVPASRYEEERALALSKVPEPQYGEYYARLAETVVSWDRLKASLADRFPDRPMIVVRYGDHQPVMTRRLEAVLRLGDDDSRQFKTFFAIEGINMELADVPVLPSSGLDISFLGTVALRAAGLPLDRVSATRASLIADCGSAYFPSKLQRKLQFHRALVDMGLIDCSKT
jgi:phosphoglycerol transferase MdoB-like AlkP superfamily enzyme